MNNGPGARRLVCGGRRRDGGGDVGARLAEPRVVRRRLVPARQHRRVLYRLAAQVLDAPALAAPAPRAEAQPRRRAAWRRSESHARHAVRAQRQPDEAIAGGRQRQPQLAQRAAADPSAGSPRAAAHLLAAPPRARSRRRVDLVDVPRDDNGLIAVPRHGAAAAAARRKDPPPVARHRKATQRRCVAAVEHDRRRVRVRRHNDAVAPARVCCAYAHALPQPAAVRYPNDAPQPWRARSSLRLGHPNFITHYRTAAEKKEKG